VGSEIERGPGFELIAASLRADAGDVATFMESLAVKLESALPGSVSVSRWRERMFGPKSVNRIVVDLGGERLELAHTKGGRVEASRARVSGGITLSSESIGIDAWIDTLSQALTRQAEQNGQTRQALEKLLLE
jgi:hypothetical protein